MDFFLADIWVWTKNGWLDILVFFEKANGLLKKQCSESFNAVRLYKKIVC